MRKTFKALLFLLFLAKSNFCESQVLVKNIEPGAASSNPQMFYPFKDKLLFVAFTTFYNWQLYVTDGTSTGTQQLTQTLNNYPAANTYGGQNPGGAFTDIDSLLYFFCMTSTGKINIWKTDASVNGTKQITNNNDNIFATATRFFKLNGKICTILQTQSQFGQPYNLFVYDPVLKSYSFKNINYDSFAFVISNNYWDVGPTPYTYNNKIYFRGGNWPDSIFSMDVNGTKQFINKMPINYLSGQNTTNYFIVNNKLIINPGTPGDPVYGDEPFYYDFATNTKGLLKDINSYFNYSSKPRFMKFSYFNKSSMKLGYFYAENPDDGTEIFYTDGTAAGTKITRNIAIGTSSIHTQSIGSGTSNLFYKGDSLILTGSAGTGMGQPNGMDSLRIIHKDQYYKSYVYYQTQPNPYIDYFFSNFIVIGNKIYFHGKAEGNIASKWDKIYRLDSYNPVDSLNLLGCTFQNTNFGNSYSNSVFLKRDSCYYFTGEICTSGFQTGKELFKFCNNKMFTLGIYESSLDKIIATVFPNPSSNVFNITCNTDQYNIEITDITGRLILKKVSHEKTMSISMENQAPGVYIYKVINKEGVLQRGKLILEK
jgi:ELWxxDGT repeat protein